MLSGSRDSVAARRHTDVGPFDPAMNRHICVIGGGASGLSAADRLRGVFDVTLFEAASVLGGHANTYFIPDGPDAGLPLDTAFMVMNRKKYPSLYGVLARLDGRKFSS